MKKTYLTGLMAFLLIGFTSCSSASDKELSEVATTETTADPKPGSMEEDARKMAEITCKIMNLMPAEITDNTVFPKELEEASKEGEVLKAEMQKKYTEKSGDWAKFEKMAQEFAMECLKK